jgi:hypothetical protein
MRSASGTGARHFFTLRDDSWPDSMAAGCGRLPQIPRPTQSPSPPAPRRAPQKPTTLAFGRLTTGSPQTKRDYAAHGGTVAMMVVSAY